MTNANEEANCLFCKIIQGAIPSQPVAVGPDFIAIRDINPQAPVHILVIPKQHVASIVQFEDGNKLGELFLAAKNVALEQGLKGFRLVVNTGEQAGQTVFHLHIHVIGGRIMLWPPG